MFSRIVLALALIAGVSAFAPATFGTRLARGKALDAGIVDTLKGLEGPGIPWGSAGVLEGFEESDIKGYDGFGKVADAIDAAGLASTLDGGEYTVFVPVDSAVKGDLSEDVLKYHVVPGKIAKGSIGADLSTIDGRTLTYKRFARKTFLDDAVVGPQGEGAATGSVYPVDVAFDGGVIHAIDITLVPGWTKVDAEAGAGGIA